MKNITPRQRFQYWFDNVMAKGTLAQIGLLFALSVIIIFIVTVVIFLLRVAPEGKGFVEVAWMGLMRTLDAGTMGGDEGSWTYLLSMFIVTLGGVFVVSTLIGVLGAGVEGKLEELRKGRSLVLEENHTAIFGWSSQIFTIISELATANENRKKQAIAILSEKDKVEMEEEISGNVEDTKTTRVICRNGLPIDLNDINMIRPQFARSIIVLPEETMPDASVVKTIMALTNGPDRRPEPYHIVTQVRSQYTLDVLRMVSKQDKIQAILVGDLLARIVAQTARQSGLSIVYTELLDFGGDEIYFKEEPGLVGKTFGEAILAYEDSCLMGMRFADGRTQLKPALDTVFARGDMVIAISEDDDTIHLANLPVIPLADDLIKAGETVEQPHPEKGLILGWNQWAATIVKNLDSYMARGSQITIVSGDGDRASVIENCVGLENVAITFHEGDTTSRAVIDKLDVGAFDHIIVLAANDLDVQHADARTMITLLHLRDIAENEQKNLSIVSEMLDLRNRQLAEVTHADDFIVSDHLISLMIAQLSENSELYDVLTDIFDPEGAEIYLKPARNYVSLDQPVNFYTVVEAARRRDEIAIGYRLESEENNENHGVYINPAKSAMFQLGPNDKVIVLAEN